MSIIRELENKGINVVKSENFYKGIHKTEKGVVVSFDKHECEESIYFLNLDNHTGKVMCCPCGDDIVYVTHGTEYQDKKITRKEAKILASEGKIFSFSCSELYAEYYDFDKHKELESCFKHGYSDKSRRYIEGVMRNIGLLSYTDATNGSMKEEGNPTNFDADCKYDIYINAETTVGRLEDDRWIAQTCYMVDIDDFAVIKMYFNHKPSKVELITAFTIRSFEMKPIEVFTCWECGHTVHWLELHGDINQKYEMAKERYCGC